MLGPLLTQPGLDLGEACGRLGLVGSEGVHLLPESLSAQLVRLARQVASVLFALGELVVEEEG
jgi:hypothetical protein